MSMRFKLPPGGDVPPYTAARWMGKSLEEFEAQLPALLERGFPRADPTTGNYDLDAINVWRRTRYPHLYREQLTLVSAARNASDVVRARLTGARDG
jgi:hypothetical protein